MGIAFGSDKGKESELVKKPFFDGLIDYAKSAKKYHERGFPAKSHSELDTVIWYAENIRERIKRENPELWK